MSTSAIPTPDLFQQESGGWLAVSRPGETVRLAVAAPGREAAERAFASSAQRWAELISIAERKRKRSVK
jgi:hypothetical protein